VDAAQARSRFAAARVARLATVTAEGRPHLVPVTFALDADTIYTAVDDAKPKATLRLARLRNIEANPAVALLADHYDDDDWDALWWVRADGTGTVHEPGERAAVHAVELLKERYPQHRAEPPEGPVLTVDVTRWSGWSAR
jgi:PPOX class probable F420-dependent enzyme